MFQSKIWVLVLALCAASTPVRSQQFEGKVIFSVEVVESSLERGPDGSKGPKERTGIFYYYKEAGPGEYGPLISGYRLQNGAVTELAGLGSYETGEFLKKLNALTISTFDVPKEIETAIATRRAEAKRTGKSESVAMTLDGAKYRIRYDFNGVRIDHTDWNPGIVIDDLAIESANLRNLRDLIDLFAASYGRRQFGL